MPLQEPGDFGTNADGSKNEEYCHYCFLNGRYIEPDITKEQMIQKCAGIMEQMHLPGEIIEQTKNASPFSKGGGGRNNCHTGRKISFFF